MHVWLRGLSKGARGTIGADLLNVQDNWPMGRPLVGSLGGGLWELRSTHGVEYRVLFAVEAGRIYLLHGFVKKTEKTPRADELLGRRRLATIWAFLHRTGR